MADSDNSRTLPVVTRRRLLSTSATWLAAQVADVSATDHAENGRPDGGDPTLMLWQEWRAAHDQVEKFCREQQRLETALIAAVGFPQVHVAVPDQEGVLAVFTMDEIERRFGDTPSSSQAKRTAKTVLAQRQAAWDEMDERLGYSRAKQSEEQAFVVRAERLADLFAQQAHSAAGAAAKLHAVLAMTEEDGPCDDFPWLQIRAVMTDLLGLGSRRSGV